MTRLEEWAKRVTDACEEARRHSRWGDEHAAAQAVLERETRALALAFDINEECIPASMQMWLDLPATPAEAARDAKESPEPTHQSTPTCAPWCGTRQDSHQEEFGGVVHYAGPNRTCLCSPACCDLGRPAHPSTGGTK